MTDSIKKHINPITAKYFQSMEYGFFRTKGVGKCKAELPTLLSHILINFPVGTSLKQIEEKLWGFTSKNNTLTADESFYLQEMGCSVGILRCYYDENNTPIDLIN